MTHTETTLRPALIEILVDMGEIPEDEGAALVSAPQSDMNFDQLNFDSLATFDFCLRLETDLQVIVDPDELVELNSLRQLEATILARQAAA